MNTCPMCGAELVESNLKFCPDCGTPLAGEEAAPEAAATPEPEFAPVPAHVLAPERIPRVVGVHGFRFAGRRGERVMTALWVFLALVLLAAIATGIYYLVEAIRG